MMEFADNGYKRASTNAIVKRAEIGKGMLFHYFNSKIELYLYLYDFAMDIFCNDFYQKMDLDNDRDLLSRCRKAAYIKMELHKKYPSMYKFVMSVYFEKDEQVKSDIDSRNISLAKSSVDRVFTGFDLSKFKEGIDINKAVAVLYWTLEGFSNSRQQQYNAGQVSYEQLIKEVNGYLKFLQKLYYKKEGSL